MTNRFLGDVNTSVEEYASLEDHFDTLQAVGDDFILHLAKFKRPYAKNMRNYANATKLVAEQAKRQLPPVRNVLALALWALSRSD